MNNDFYMICHAILNNEKRLSKVRALKAKGAHAQRQKLRNYVIGECATQNKRLTEDDMYKAVAYIENRMDSKAKETINKDGSITLTSQDGKYNVNYVVNDKNGNLVDEWEDLMDKVNDYTCPMYDWE